MKTTIEIKNLKGDVLFSYESENNTIKKTLEKSVSGGADLSGADFRGADLRDANLSCADLSGANLRGADLRGADFRGADLSYADLSCADLSGANLSCADLSYADLSYANIRGANLSCADLSGANIRGADLSGANIRGAIGFDLVVARTRILPEGDIIGYKQCKNNIIVKLLIPANAKRCHAFGRKCRAEYATVLEIYGADIAYSSHDKSFIYEVGKTVKPTEPFCEDFTNECSSGIHFFITKTEAENY